MNADGDYWSNSGEHEYDDEKWYGADEPEEYNNEEIDEFLGRTYYYDDDMDDDLPEDEEVYNYDDSFDEDEYFDDDDDDFDDYWPSFNDRGPY